MSQRSRAKRAPFVVTIAMAATAAACGGSVGSDGSGGSGGSGGGGTGGIGNPPLPECPTGKPSSGDACAPVGQSCNYSDECGQPITATCGKSSTWIVETPGTCNPPPPPEDCPNVEPTLGNWCNVDPTEYCSYPGLCGCSTDYQCVDNVWVDASPSCNPPNIPCPDQPPTAGTSCDPCGFAYCQYDQCAATGSTLNAICEGGNWSVNPAPCGG